MGWEREKCVRGVGPEKELICFQVVLSSFVAIPSLLGVKQATPGRVGCTAITAGNFLIYGMLRWEDLEGSVTGFTVLFKLGRHLTIIEKIQIH